MIEIDALRALVDAGHLVIAGGGGGIPVRATGPHGGLVDAVIDKDRAAGLIARLLGAQALLLVTAVDRVMLDYGKPTQSELGTITAAEAARHLAEGQFPPGSMGPKIEAALRFLDERRGTGGDHLARPAGGHAGRRGAGGRAHASSAARPTRSAEPVSTGRHCRCSRAPTGIRCCCSARPVPWRTARGVTWATAAMATPAAVEDLTGRGFPPDDLAGADANALVLAVRAADDECRRRGPGTGPGGGIRRGRLAA